jgi:hypothetical protein
MNTTFDAKEAVKYMLDGFTIVNVTDGSIYRFTKEFIIKKTSNFGTNEIQLLDFISGKNETKTNYTFDCLYRIRKDLVQWYRPKFIWQENSPSNSPSEWQEDKDFYPTKKAFLDSYDKTGIHDIKVLKWEIEYFPAMYEDCE